MLAEDSFRDEPPTILRWHRNQSAEVAAMVPADERAPEDPPGSLRKRLV